jgi:GxxExxY protein
MPIHCPLSIRTLSADEFEQCDYRVMGHSYASQNELGRLCEEGVYEADLKSRLLADGFREVHTQVPVTVTHGIFSKAYYLDLIADDGLYELKCHASLTGEDDAQLIHYILLLGIQRGKLLNFRTPKVEGRIHATGLTQNARRQVHANSARWQELSPDCRTLRETLLTLLSDWGAFLEVSLYQKALIHFLGGETNVVRRLLLSRNGMPLAAQRFLVHASGVGFRLTALTDGITAQESHLRRLLALTDLRAMQWINLNHTEIQLVTLTRDGRGMGAME